MEKNNNFLLRFLILFWVVCVVFCAHQKNHHKRDVHRIILKGRSPRSHKNHGHHGHNHSRKKGHKNKGKRGSNESFSGSFEDHDSYSNENSFEEGFQGQKNRPKQPNKKPSYHRHRFPSNLDIEETRQHSFREEMTPFYNSDWIPLNSDPLHLASEHHQSQHRDPYPEKDLRNNRQSKKHPQKSHNKNKFYGVDFTTSTSPVTFESQTLYPPIDVLSSFNALNSKLLKNNPSIISPQFDQTAKDPNDKLKNHRTSYDVTEGQGSEYEEYILVPDKAAFGSLDYGPAGKYNVKETSNHNSKNRGRNKYKSNSRF